MVLHADPETLPDYVKNATLDQLGLDTDLPPERYAYQQDGRVALPCHTKAACFLSRLYFETQRDELNSTQLRRCEAKLAAFEKLHAIEPAEIKAAVNSMEQASKQAASPQLLASQAAMAYGKDPNRYPASELVLAARELKTAGASNQFINDWAFDRPLKRAGQQIRLMANQFEDEQIAKLANRADHTPPRELPALMGELANELQRVTHSNVATQRKLAELAYHDNLPIRLLDRDIDPRKLLPHLPKIAMLTELPLLREPLRIPRDDWETTLEAAGPAVHRQILDSLAVA